MLFVLWLFLMPPKQSSLTLAGERVQFAADFTPRFTPVQMKKSAEATRSGLAKLARTPHGKKLLAFFNGPEYEIRVTEDPNEEAAGRAPQPGIATFMAVHDRGKVKVYDLILNPAFFSLPKGMQPLLNAPATPADMMAVAWAGEMLHIYFYAQGINLPHHPRPDFQDQWRDLAEELGMGLVTHNDDVP